MLSVIMGGGSGKRLCQYNMVDVGGILNYNVKISIDIYCKNELCKLNSNTSFEYLFFV